MKLAQAIRLGTSPAGETTWDVPDVLPTLTSPRPFGTISFAAHLFDRGWSPAEPLFHRSRLVGAQQGYFVELRELFTARGELCAVNQQTMAIIK